MTNICEGIKKDGNRCSYKSKTGGFCLRHQPNTSSSVTTQSQECPECPICYEPIKNDIKTLCCQHVFHVTCVNKWLDRHTTCPMCRTNQNDIPQQPIEQNDPEESIDLVRQDVNRWFDEYEPMVVIAILESVPRDIFAYVTSQVVTIVIEKLEYNIYLPQEFLHRLIDISCNDDTTPTIEIMRTRLIELVTNRG